jgi:hypothetical protein
VRLAGRAGLAAVGRRLAALPRLARAALVVVLAFGLSAAGTLLATGSGGGAASRRGFPVVDSGHGLVATTRATLVAELRAEAMHWTGVDCVANGRSYEHHPVVRCNVDFGDPHVQAYCTVIAGGRLLSNTDDPAIPCGEDDAGFQIITYPDYLAHATTAATHQPGRAARPHR